MKPMGWESAEPAPPQTAFMPRVRVGIDVAGQQDGRCQEQRAQRSQQVVPGRGRQIVMP